MRRANDDGTGTVAVLELAARNDVHVYAGLASDIAGNVHGQIPDVDSKEAGDRAANLAK